MARVLDLAIHGIVPAANVPSFSEADYDLLIQDRVIRGRNLGAQRQDAAVLENETLALHTAWLDELDGWVGRNGQHVIQAPKGQSRKDAISLIGQRVFRAADPMRRIKASLRQDSGSAYYFDSLTDTSLPAIRRPQQALTLLSSIPMRTVAAGANRYARRYVDHYGKAAPYRAGQTQYPFVGVTRTEDTRPLETFVVATEDNWLERLHDGYSGLNNGAEKIAAATRALEEAMQATLTTDLGLSLLNLTNLPMMRASSSLTYGTATADQLLADMLTAADYGTEQNRAAGGFNAVLISERLINRMSRITNFTGGGATSTAWKVIAERLSEKGITRIVIERAMENIGGTNIDGALFFDANVTDQGGLAHIVAMRPAPVHTWEGPGGRCTVWATRVGGLELPVMDSAMLYLATVTAT